jgi:hypothetical protein
MGADDVMAVRFRRRTWERRDLKGEVMGIEMKV